jgi:hypothetical protein
MVRRWAGLLLQRWRASYRGLKTMRATSYFSASFCSQAREQVSCCRCVWNALCLGVFANSASRLAAYDPVDGSRVESGSLEPAL